jgi:twitching motility protein PilT
MQTMNQSLHSLYTRRLISLEDALGRSSEPDELKQMIGNAGMPSGMQRRPTNR